jgi:CheY-like chemotaxis protein
MMRILVIEDHGPKLEQIQAVVESTLPNAVVTVARSYQSGLRSILSGGVDLILLDMTLPTFDTQAGEPGGDTLAYGGRDILDSLQHRGVSIPVIVVTQFDSFGKGVDRLTLRQLDAELKEQHGSTYLGASYYNPAIAGWSEGLRGMIQAAANAIKDKSS